MKKIFERRHVLQALFVLLVFVGCEEKNAHFTHTLLLEQSQELTRSNQGELYGLLSELAEINVREGMQTSYEYEKISSMYDELEKFNLEMQDADRTQLIQLINSQNAKFKNDPVFKVPGFKFVAVKIEELEQLEEDVLKAYAVSKISRFYVHSAGYIFTTRHYGRERL